MASAGDDAKSEHDATPTVSITMTERVRFATARQLAQCARRRHWSARFPAQAADGNCDNYFLCEEAEPDGTGGGGVWCEPLPEADAATELERAWPLAAEAGEIMKRNGTAARMRNARATSEWRFMGRPA